MTLTKKKKKFERFENPSTLYKYWYYNTTFTQLVANMWHCEVDREVSDEVCVHMWLHGMLVHNTLLLLTMMTDMPIDLSLTMFVVVHVPSNRRCFRRRHGVIVTDTHCAFDVRLDSRFHFRYLFLFFAPHTI
jgi:hypothetical protein